MWRLRLPVLDSIGDKEVNEGELLTFTVTATDPDGDLAYMASNLDREGASTSQRFTIRVR